MTDLSTPYAPPRSDSYPQTVSEGELSDASQQTRFVNFLIDSAGRTLLMLGVMFGFGALGMETLGAIVGMLSIPGYYFVSEATLGRTPAKFLTGTRVVGMDGQPASVMQLLGRSMARFIPLEPFSFLGKSTRGWHDSLSGTRVVKD